MNQRVSQHEMSQLRSVSLKPEVGPAPDKCFDEMHGKPLVVCLQNLDFGYKRKERLLHGLNVSITGGQIYALLGPSSCGKSTTLKLILGLLRPNSGQVFVYGGKPNTSLCPIPGAAGYMPQELSLMPTMTVADHFLYYGRLSAMSVRQIGKRTVSLLTLMQLPSMERPIESLSGGQQRRVSLALALMHSPSLLILDEPTVGIDPILRNIIWSYLQELATTEGKTIILTTHYIEEARNASTIALMRDGALLAEANPSRLLDSFQMSSIEEVFLNLCEKEDTVCGESAIEMQADKKAKQASESEKSKKKMREMVTFAKYPGRWPHHGHSFNWLRVWAILADCFTFIHGNGKLATIIIICLMPSLQIALFHFSIGKPVDRLPIAVSTPESGPTRFSDVFIDELQARGVQVAVYKSVNGSVDSVSSGLAFASLAFSPNFTRCLVNRVRLGAQVSDYNLACSRIQMVSDHTFPLIIFQLALQLRDSFLGSIYRFLPRLGYNPGALELPFQVEETVYGSEKFAFQEFMTPGMYMALIYIAPMVVTLFVLLEQKSQGHIERALAAGAKPAELLVAHFLTNSLILLLQTASMMTLSLVYFEASNRGSLPLLLAIVYLEGIAGISLALLMASLMKNKLAVIVLISGLTIGLWFISGVFWPTQNITITLVRRGVLFLPLTLPIETARNIMNRGWSWDQQGVLLGFASATVYTAVPLLLAYLVFK